MKQRRSFVHLYDLSELTEVLCIRSCSNKVAQDLKFISKRLKRVFEKYSKRIFQKLIRIISNYILKIFFPQIFVQAILLIHDNV